jgi:hypothetical protein
MIALHVQTNDKQYPIAKMMSPTCGEVKYSMCPTMMIITAIIRRYLLYVKY